MPVNIVIIGGSFGGLATAYELRRQLGPDDASITVVSKDPNFVFIPSLPWVSMGKRTAGQISFDLGTALARQKVDFVHETVLHIDRDDKTITTDNSTHHYDFLVVATGHRSANEAVDGLGPFDGPGHSLMSLAEAEELHGAVRKLINNPGPVVVGAAPGASCIGPSYEFAFMLDHLLRSKKLRNRVPITFLTPEPFLGHMGMGGVGKIRQVLEGAFEERDITYQTSAAITKIGDDFVEVGGTTSIPSALTMVIPPLSGVEAIAKSPGVANPKGFIPVDAHYRFVDTDSIYCVGVAVAMKPVDLPPVPVNFPKTGHMTEQMAEIAAADIVSRIKGTKEGPTPDLSASCVMDLGSRGIFMNVNPVRPPRNKIPRVSDGRQWLLAKLAFERLYLSYGRRGKRVPTTLGW